NIGLKWRPRTTRAMFVLDENMLERHRRLLEAWRIHVSQVGVELARKGTLDENIIPLLHQLGRATFFTRDRDYYRPGLRHPRYCLVLLDVPLKQIPERIRRFLRHRSFRTWAQRKGAVIRVSEAGMSAWRLKARKVELVPW